MRYCSHCVMPDTRPGIKFSKENPTATGGGGGGFAPPAPTIFTKKKQTLRLVLRS